MGCAVACTDERDMHSSDPDTKIMIMAAGLHSISTFARVVTDARDG